jgi:hypothetical protein
MKKFIKRLFIPLLSYYEFVCVLMILALIIDISAWFAFLIIPFALIGALIEVKLDIK